MVNVEQLRIDYIVQRLFPQLFNVKDYTSFASQNSNILLGIGIIYGLFILLSIIRRILSLKHSIEEESVLLELTPPAFTEKTSYTTQQLFAVIHNLGENKTFIDKLFGRKNIYSFEIASSLNQGIRYLIRTTPEEANNIKRNVLSYLSNVNVKTVDEYLPENTEGLNTKVVEFKLKRHFAYPLEKQNILKEHDPVAYITGMMTKLEPKELVSFQIVISPTRTNEVNIIKQKILRDDDVLAHLDRIAIPSGLGILLIPLKIISVIFNILMSALTIVINDHTGVRKQPWQYQQEYAQPKKKRSLNRFEQEAVKAVEDKIDQQLFETKIRLLVLVKSRVNLNERVKGFASSLAVFSVPGFQAFHKKPNPGLDKVLLLNFKKRLLSLVSNSSPYLLSASEISDLYHFPFTSVTQTENIVKIHSKELPAPLSLKQDGKLSVVFGKNTYGGTTTPIGLTADERKTHMYIIGRTGSGKTTLMFSMAKQDIENGEGLAFIDPHGDVSEDLLACVPEARRDDVIYLNPFDLKHPIGINLLELTPGLDEDEAELEKEVVAEGVVSLFRKVFSKEENANAHRIEYILRNTIHTAFTTEEPTIFTLYDLLNNPPYQKQVVSRLQDENLKNFWKFEFGRAGDYQVVKMVGGVTAKIGRFLFSPTAKRILEQKKSTINFSEILNGKILICNLSQGKLGEDTARLLGTTILTKLQQAALKRVDIPQSKRRQFHLYVDEFQNFATLSFAKMLSEGRKYGLEVCIAEQSTSQQQDRSIVNIILSNVTTVICFRSGNPIDEQLMLSQFAPYVEHGEIQNLPRYRFYIKISAIESEEPFSGETIFVPVKKDPKKRERLIEISRKNNAIVYQKVKPQAVVNPTKSKEKDSVSSEQIVVLKGGFPVSKVA